MGGCLALTIAIAALASGCEDSDVGRCCKVLPGRDESAIPMPEASNGQPRDIVRIDPAFDCEDLTCVSFQGSTAYCTRECVSQDNCPEGFSCEPVLQSDPGPDAGIKPTTKFCVKAMHMCTQ